VVRARLRASSWAGRWRHYTDVRTSQENVGANADAAETSSHAGKPALVALSGCNVETSR
jgi:hypothetical protein